MTTARLALTRSRKRPAASKSAEPLGPRIAASTAARTITCACARPRRGGMYARAAVEKSSSPMRSEFCTAEKAKTAASSAAMSHLRQSTEPKPMEPETSTATMTVRSRSSTNSLTCGTPLRAVTFQSMVRMSSPGWYSRTCANSIPRP